MRKHSTLAAAALAVVTVLGGAGTALADADAGAKVANSPGILSGNAVQVPIDLNLNLCGNTVDVIGALNPATGNKCKTH
ncbi:chaplin [Streptomyces sp. NPDC050147]|uniref:chaplin n=1 Tax=Streptomyces sp. NPDC050147 TaxID=3155513 RepID=UPI00343BC8F9